MPLRASRSLALGVASAAIGPAYLALVAYAARVAPWPRALGRLVAFVLLTTAAARLTMRTAKVLLRPGGWAEQELGLPPAVTRQWRRAITALVAVGVVFLGPAALLGRGLIDPGGRPEGAPALGRLLVLGFEVAAWWIVAHLLRGRSATVGWLAQAADRLGWVGRHRRAAAWSVLAALGGVIGLDACGYSFSARRLAAAGGQSLVLVAACAGAYWLLIRAIDHHAWRWIRPANRGARPAEEDHPDDLAGRLRRLAAWAVPALGLLAGVWIWNVDLALFRTVGSLPLPPHGVLTVGDVTEAAVILALTTLAWRHLSTLFAVAIYPRLPEDPGLRFAALTLCRYAVLALGTLAGLSALHLGSKEIGVVVAALGVGLGFGLQEIVSNFVSGLILLVERPIRVGDIVTVAGMSGMVDRINIRATTIINAENQSIIVPNREFITGNLVNWTHKDRTLRVSVRVGVAHGTDPDKVADLLLTIAREDPEVLRNPVPAALLEQFEDSALGFVLHVYVPDPALGGRVRHRIGSQIQKRFEASGIAIPFPTRHLLVHSARHEEACLDPVRPVHLRTDGQHAPPPPPAHIAPPGPVAAPMTNRCVDE